MVAADVGSDIDRVRALIEEHGIHTVECMFADTWGIPRGKRLPAKQFLKSPGLRHRERRLHLGHALVHLPDRLRERGARLPGHACRRRPLDLSRRRLARGTGVLHLRHGRSRDPRAGRARRPPDPAPGGRARSRARLRADGGHRARVPPLHGRLAALLHRRPLLLDGERSGGRERRRRYQARARRIGHRGRGLQRRVRPGAGRGEPCVRAGDRGGRQHHALQVRRQADCAAARPTGDLHAEALHGRGRQRNAHPPEPRPGREERLRRARRRPARALGSHEKGPRRPRRSPSRAARGDGTDCQRLQAGRGLLVRSDPGELGPRPPAGRRALRRRPRPCDPPRGAVGLRRCEPLPRSCRLSRRRRRRARARARASADGDRRSARRRAARAASRDARGGPPVLRAERARTRRSTATSSSTRSSPCSSTRSACSTAR